MTGRDGPVTRILRWLHGVRFVAPSCERVGRLGSGDGSTVHYNKGPQSSSDAMDTYFRSFLSLLVCLFLFFVGFFLVCLLVLFFLFVFWFVVCFCFWL